MPLRPLKPFWTTTDHTTIRLYQGDVVEVLQRLPANSVHCCTTSPPYWSLRSYLSEDHEDKKLELGSEPSPDCNSQGQAQCGRCFVCAMVKVFREVRRVLHDSGVLILNLGDTYGQPGRWGGALDQSCLQSSNTGTHSQHVKPNPQTNLPSGNLLGIPWRVALALQADGWILRSDIPWVKRCLSGGTVVYARTQKGDMPTTIKDLVRLKPETVKMWDGEKWNQVKAFHRTIPERSSRRKRGEVSGYLDIELRNGEKINCTAEHGWPVIGKGLVRADKLVVGDVLQKTKLPQSENPRSPAYLEDELVGWFVGMYLAEGCMSDSVIMLHGHKKETKSRLQRLDQLAYLYDGVATSREREGESAITSLSGQVLIGIINQYISGNDCYNKRLSRCAWKRSNAFLWAVLDGYLEGDGCEAGDRWRLGFCDNYGLVIDLRTICARLGIRCRIRKSKHSAVKGGKLHNGWKGEIRLTSHSYQQPPGGFPVTEDTEVVAIRASRSRCYWDIELEESPHLFALASGVLSHNSPMPESVTNRPAKALEYVFLFAKKQGYYWDGEAIKRKSLTADLPPRTLAPKQAKTPFDGKISHNEDHARAVLERVTDRNFRNADLWFASIDEPHGLTGIGDELVGIDVTSEAYGGLHFATFPRKLIEPFIKAGSAPQCCAQCGTPWLRLTERTQLKRERPNDYVKRDGAAGTGNSCANTVAGVTVTTKGWRPNCECCGKLVKRTGKRLGYGSYHNHSQDGVGYGLRQEGKGPASNPGPPTKEFEATRVEYVSDLPLANHPTKPCIILDPFCGSGTTCIVALEHGRASIGIDLSVKYLQENAIPRIEGKLLSKGTTAGLVPPRPIKRVEVGIPLD